jgi:hypothetical protein
MLLRYTMNMNTDSSQKNIQKYFTQPKDYFMLFLGLISLIYLLNFTFGGIELLPDILPIIGNIDEAFMTTLLLSVLHYFNINITSWFKR